MLSMDEKISEKQEIKSSEPKQEKKRFRIRGSNSKETLENISFFIIVISAIMISVGIGLGSFIQYIVFIAVLGSFFVMFGIVVYIASQFMEDKNG